MQSTVKPSLWPRRASRNGVGTIATVLIVSGSLFALSAPALATTGSGGSGTAIYSVTLKDGSVVTKSLPLAPASTNAAPGDTSGSAGGTASPPVAVPLSGASPDTTQNGNTCDYYPANIIGWDLSNTDSTHYGYADENYPRSNYNETGGTYSENDGYGSNSGNAQALVSVGTDVPMPSNWPQPSTVKMTFPWSDFGNLYTYSSFSPLPYVGGYSEGDASFTLSIQGFQNSLEGSAQVDSDGISNRTGTSNAKDVQRSYRNYGSTPPSLTLSTPPSATMLSYLHIDMESSDSSVIGAYGEGDTTFQPGSETYYFGLPYAQWTYNLPSGYTVASCGG
jgi:hypothetical protein